MTHLHFDHSGGTTRRTAAARLEPVFQARAHVVQRARVGGRHAPARAQPRQLPAARTSARSARRGCSSSSTARPRSRPACASSRRPATPPATSRCCIGAEPDGPKALFLGDVVPTAVHTRLPWVMAYDLDPARTVETKRALFTRALDEDWLLLWGHDRDHAAGRLGVDKDGNRRARVRDSRAGVPRPAALTPTLSPQTDRRRGEGDRRGDVDGPRPGLVVDIDMDLVVNAVVVAVVSV